MRFLPILFCLLFLSCKKEAKEPAAIAEMEIELDFTRFDRLFAQASAETLPNLKGDYPQFFPPQFADSVWIARISDTLQMALNREVNRAFPPEGDLEFELREMIKRAAYFIPGFQNPPVYTVISDVDYQQPILYSPQGLVIGLDNFLGSDHPFYDGIPRYIVANMRPEQVVPAAAEAVVKPFVAPPSDRSFLAGMIYHGKRLYMESLLLPGVVEHELIGYTSAQWVWSQENEVEIWRYFIESELLYDTDPKLYPRFLNKAPFSKFYLEIDNESPGAIGRYIGYRIVQDFMERSDETSLDELMAMGHDELYRSSGFKPTK